LTPYARIYRYPGHATEPSREQFDQALSAAEGLYRFVVSLLPPEMRLEWTLLCRAGHWRPTRASTWRRSAQCALGQV